MLMFSMGHCCFTNSDKYISCSYYFVFSVLVISSFVCAGVSHSPCLKDREVEKLRFLNGLKPQGKMSDLDVFLAIKAGRSRESIREENEMHRKRLQEWEQHQASIAAAASANQQEGPQKQGQYGAMQSQPQQQQPMAMP